MDAFFNAIYSRFLLRDLFAKIVPGSLAMCAAAVLYPRLWSLLDGDPPVLIWLLLLGLAWIVGLAVQEIGETLGLLRFHNARVSADVYRQQRLEAQRLSKQRESQELERFLVLKEAAGVASISFTLLALALPIRAYLEAGASPLVVPGIHPDAREILREGGTVSKALVGALIPSVLAFAAAVFLLRMHRRMVRVECDYISTVRGAVSRDEIGNGELPKDKPPGA